MPIPILTKANHFKFGYDYDWYRSRLHETERFTVAFDTTSRLVQDWPSECVAAASAIKDIADAPIELLFSGGIDSEIAVRSFITARIPFTAHILRFHDGLNAHDIVRAIRFCEVHGVSYRIHDLDILQFFETDLYDFAAVSQCVSPKFCALMWLIDQLDGYVVLGAKQPNLVRRPSGLWALRESEIANACYRYFLAIDRPGVPGFHQYTPELMLSYLLKFVEHATSDQNQSEVDARHFFWERRERYTGYELVMDQDAVHRARLTLLYPQHDDTCHMDVAFVLDHLRGSHNHPRGCESLKFQPIVIGPR